MSHDNSILSAYLDDEVPSPWKEQLSERIENDPTLMRRYAGLEAVRTAMRSVPEPDFEESKERVWKSIASAGLKPPTPQIWRRRVVLPVPLVAAAALVVVVFGSLFTYREFFDRRADAVARDISSFHSGDLSVMLNVDDGGVEQLLQWLNAQQQITEVKIQLPDTPRFEIIGEPELLKVSDPQRGRR